MLNERVLTDGGVTCHLEVEENNTSYIIYMFQSIFDLFQYYI